MIQPATQFDFDTHRRAAVEEYREVRPLYESFAGVLHRILDDAFRLDEMQAASVEHRAKALDSFGEKAATPDETDPEKPKYPEPLKQITDLAGVRVVTFFPKTVPVVGAIIEREFDVVERSDKSAELIEEERFGYQSVHFVVRLPSKRTQLPEYARLKGLIAEIQVRTILQHAWAEIEHDIQYKAVATIPAEVKRRFMAIAGLLEIADREFQAIQDADKDLRVQARQSVAQGQLDSVGITPDALKAYLDRKYGEDGRMRPASYDWTARLLLALGFANLQEVESCISQYDDDKVSRVIWGSRQGQLGRFESVLLAALGERFIDKSPVTYPGYREWKLGHLGKLKDAGVEVGKWEKDVSAGPGHSPAP